MGVPVVGAGDFFGPRLRCCSQAHGGATGWLDGYEDKEAQKRLIRQFLGAWRNLCLRGPGSSGLVVRKLVRLQWLVGHCAASTPFCVGVLCKTADRGCKTQEAGEFRNELTGFYIYGSDARRRLFANLFLCEVASWKPFQSLAVLG
jgi:hypothetical protein